MSQDSAIFEAGLAPARTDAKGWTRLPLPTFTFAAWITGLAVGILVLAALTPLARVGRPWMRRLSFFYGTFMALNGLVHLVASLMLGRWMPGVVSSPFLLAAEIFLLTSVPERAEPEARRSAAISI